MDDGIKKRKAFIFLQQMKSRDSLLPKYYLPCKVIREFNYEPNMEAASSTVIYLDFLGFLPGCFHFLIPP